MRRLKDLSAYSLAHNITYQREGVELLALPIFWFTTIDQVEPETVLTSDIWQVVAKLEQQKLLA